MKSQTPNHVVIDGSLISKPRGIGRYVEELLRALATQPLDGLHITVLIPKGTDIPGSLWHPSITYQNVRVPPFPVWEQLVLPYWLLRLRPTVVHFPYNTHSWLSLLMPLRRVVTVHDLIFMDSNGGNRYQALGNLYRRVCARVLQGCRSRFQVITDSHYSRQIIQQRLGVEAQVVYISVGDADRRDNSLLDVFKLKTKGYFVHVGGISPHKNTANTITAFNAAALGTSTPLIVTGVPPDAPLAIANTSDSIIFPGWISTEQMRGLMHNTIAVIFPSYVEGYGMPIVEAFAQGVAVITSDRAPMNELAKLAANPGMCSLIDPDRRVEITNEIVLASQAKHQQGYSQVAALSSSQMGHQMSIIYHIQP